MPMELSALARTSPAVMLCLAQVLCAVWSVPGTSLLWRFLQHSTGHQDLVPVQGRGAGASPGTLAGTSYFHLHNGDCNITTINPLWDIFNPGCADEGEMTGSLCIWTMRSLSQLQPPGAMGEVWAVPPGKAALTGCSGSGLAGSSYWCRLPPSFSL